MARKFVPNGQKVKCSFGKGESNINITRPSTTKLHDQVWATTADKTITPFQTCTCPSNVSRVCKPQLREWLPNTVATNVKNEGNNFLLGSSQNTCIANATFLGLIEIDLEDATVSKDAEDFAKNNPVSNEESGSASNPALSPSEGGASAPDTDEVIDSNTDDSSWRELKEGENIKDDLELAARKRMEEEEQQTQDLIAAAEKQIEEGKVVNSDEIREATEATIAKNERMINESNASADALDYQSKNPDPASEEQWMKDLEAGMPKYQDPYFVRSAKSGAGYVEGVVTEMVIDPIVGTYDLGKGVITSLDDIAYWTAYRSPQYLLPLAVLSPEEYETRIILNQIQDDALWLHAKETVKNAPGQYVEEWKQLERDVNSGDDYLAGKATGKGVGKVLPLKKIITQGAKLFKKDAWKELDLKGAIKGELLDSISGGIYSKLPYINDVRKILNSAKDAKTKLNEIKGVLKSFNKGVDPSTHHKSPAPEPPKKVPEGTGDNNKPDGQQAGGTVNKNDPDSTENKTTNKQCTGKDPVNFVTGAMFYEEKGFEIPGVIPIQWAYYWHSDSKYKGPLGHGAHHNYDIHLKIKKDHIITILADGRPAFFPIFKENDKHYNRTEKLTLKKTNSNNFELFDHTTQLKYHLDLKNRDIYHLTKISNSQGARINFEYHNTILTKIIDTVGREINIEVNNKNLISRISAHHKNKKRNLVTYKYNDAGDVTHVIDAKGSIMRMNYKNHLVVSKTGREGQTFYWEYDGLFTGSKCIRVWGDGGLFEASLEYHKGYTIVTDKPHGITTYHHENNLSTRIVDPLGGEEIREYNKYEELVKIIDEEGNETAYDYDSYGNINSVKQPDNTIYEYAYDDKGRLQVSTKPEGGSTINSYKNEQLDCIIQSDDTMTTFEYNKLGLVSKVFNNQDNETQLFYDNEHNLIKMILPNGSTSHWEYNEWGQCIKVIDVNKQEQVFEYDLMGNATKIQLPDQNLIQLKYDAYGEVIEAVDKDRTIKLEYTPFGNLKTREENGTKVYFQYNNEEELMGIINEHGESYKFTRDHKGNISSEQGFDGLTRKFVRDRAGKVVKVERPDDKYSFYEYDKGGRISRIEHQDGTWTTYTYNKDGLLVEAVNPNSHIKISRDKAGRILTENQDGHIVTSQYGELGIRTGVTSSLGADINFEHSIMGEVINMTAKTNQKNPWEADFYYNSLGMETERVLPGGVVSTWGYDHNGSPKQHHVKNKHREQRNRSYTWDVNSKLKKITNTLGQGSTRFKYDAFNSLASAQYEDGSYDYKLPDKVGNLYRTKDQNDRKYGESGKLLKTKSSTYTYDEEGNLTEKNTPKGTWNYIWEAGGLLQTVIKPDRTKIAFEYDALGRRTAKIKTIITSSGLKGQITRFLWDGNVPLHEWQYDLKDRPNTIVNESGIITKSAKEPVEELTTWIFNQNTFKPAAKITGEDSYSIITDYLGTPVEMYNSKGEKTWQAEYDIYGKVRKLVIGSLNDCPFRYQGQYEDIEIGLYYNRFRYYAPDSGTYISQDPIGLAGRNPNQYAYVKDVNTWLDRFGLNVEYFPTDSLGRPTGGIAEVNSSNLGSGTDAAIDPPGWQGGSHPHHQQRGHLIANNHGGSGTDPRNIVTITDGTNHPGMTKIENKVTKHVRDGNTVLIEVTPNYTGNNLVPDSINMYAIDQNGNVIADTKIENGLRQKTKCCP